MLNLLAYGANLPRPDRSLEGTVTEAINLLEDNAEIDVLATSRLHRSPAFPAGSGPDFVNGAAAIDSSLAPDRLLAAMHAVEARLGRVRGRRWGPRVIDLDLLASGDLVLPDAETEAHWRCLPTEEAAERVPEVLVLPHPRMAERAFVLAPLAEVAPDWRHPATGRSVREMLVGLDPAERAAVTPLPAHPQVLRTAELGPSGRASTTRHIVGGEACGRFHRLQIVRLPGAHGVELRYLGAGGREITNTWHARLRDALAQARSEFGLEAADWQGPSEPAAAVPGTDDA